MAFEEVDVEVRTGVFTDRMALPLLTGTAHAALDAGAITQEQHDSWTAEHSARAERGRLFLVLPIFVASATRRWSGALRDALRRSGCDLPFGDYSWAPADRQPDLGTAAETPTAETEPIAAVGHLPPGACKDRCGFHTYLRTSRRPRVP